MLLSIMLVMVLTLSVSADSVTAMPASHKIVEQTTCPVMEGNPISKALHVDYRGKRVYFCCNMCAATFQKNPENYLAELPQFQNPVSTADYHEEPAHDHGNSAKTPSVSIFKPGKFVAPLGIATFATLFMTVLTGVFRRKLSKRFMIVHKVLAFLALILAASHGLLVILFH